MRRYVLLALCIVPATCRAAVGQMPAPVSVSIDWQHVVATSRTTITLQVVENPPLRRGSPIHDAAWENLAALHTDMTRLALWYPYPRLAVAELAPPSKQSTSWDLKDIDDIVEDFFHATAQHPAVFTMSTIPAWMFKGGDPGPIPLSPDEAMWNYETGADLLDRSGQQVADYFARVAGWYTAGGFQDELGKRHASQHHHAIAWWEILNEPEYEHTFDIATYTALYDRVVSAVHAVSPKTKFIGMSLAEPMRSPEKFEYFLDPRNHAPNIPLDAISYHFYADAEPGESDAAQAYTFFANADAFLNAVRYIEAVRKRLSPGTQTHINEAGCIAADDLAQGAAHTGRSPAAQYWNLCGAVFAYLYAGLAEQGVEVLGASQLLGYPSQFPSVTMLNWRTGAPNARYRVLQLLHDNLGPGDRIVRAKASSQSLAISAYMGAQGQRKLLLVNKRDDALTVLIPGARGQAEQHVDVTTSSSEPARSTLASDSVTLQPYSVMVVHLRGSPQSGAAAR